jgi:hypothetical protein
VAGRGGSWCDGDPGAEGDTSVLGVWFKVDGADRSYLVEGGCGIVVYVEVGLKIVYVFKRMRAGSGVRERGGADRMVGVVYVWGREGSLVFVVCDCVEGVGVEVGGCWKLFSRSCESGWTLHVDPGSDVLQGVPLDWDVGW